ncbi:hypothetical protein SynRS9907_02963 [Synechococcus sp. RS9907]|nr:hypothetical protein SynRS9907_02963 [Synechococcus sp. RS9907]QNI98804.1 hypothetical protein SynRS9902_02942 [Synechococcus sp. RS9902]
MSMDPEGSFSCPVVPGASRKNGDDHDGSAPQIRHFRMG